MTRTMLTTQLFAAAAMLLVTVGALPAAAQTFDAAVEAYERSDYATALAGFQNYAEQGTAAAQFNLGRMYANGEGVLEDAVYAYAWLSIAAAQGNTNAKEGKELVTKLMTQAQITEAQKRSRKYWPRYVVPFQ